MMPDISAGSNQVGASETCTPQVSWLCGFAARAGAIAAANSRTVRRQTRGRPSRNLRSLIGAAGTAPAFKLAMAFSLQGAGEVVERLPRHGILPCGAILPAQRNFCLLPKMVQVPGRPLL